MKLTKERIGIHAINWISAILLLILFFFKAVGGESLWAFANESPSFFIILLLPLILVGLSLFKEKYDLEIHLSWVILSSMTIAILLVLNSVVSSFASFGSMLGDDSLKPTVVFYLIMILYIITLVYNSAVILKKATSIQNKVADTLNPLINKGNEK